MTPQLAAMLTIHEAEAPDATLAGRRFAPGYGSLVPFPSPAVKAADSDEHALPSLLRREAQRRRLLATADVLAAGAALTLVLTLVGQSSPGIAILAAMPLVIFLFKIAGLYDRDQLRIVR